MRDLRLLDQYRAWNAEMMIAAKSGYALTERGRSYGGVFVVPNKPGRPVLRIVVSRFDADKGECNENPAWNHVSVSTKIRCPTWDEMCRIKSLFFDDETTVMQLHPPKSEWISNHKYCLHLWQPVNVSIPMPPSDMVGIRELGTLKERK